jgi:hypothetical protein
VFRRVVEQLTQRDASHPILRVVLTAGCRCFKNQKLAVLRRNPGSRRVPINPSEIGSVETSEYIAYFLQRQRTALIGHDLGLRLQSILCCRGNRNAQHPFWKDLARQR